MFYTAHATVNWKMYYGSFDRLRNPSKARKNPLNYSDV